MTRIPRHPYSERSHVNGNQAQINKVNQIAAAMEDCNSSGQKVPLPSPKMTSEPKFTKVQNIAP